MSITRPSITVHAADRFAERVRPGLTTQQARYELARLIREHGQPVPTRPAWLSSWAGTADHWIVIGTDIAVPVRNKMAVTCLTRGAQRPEILERRRHRKEERRKRARWRANRHGPRALPA